jgi:protein ImuB
MVRKKEQKENILPVRRALALWFPRLAAERALRRHPPALPGPLAVVGDRGGAQVITSLNAEGAAAGLAEGQPLRDATAVCPGLVTVQADPAGEAAFLGGLRRWAGKFSPWVAEEPPAALMVDLTGCAHLFGGEEPLIATLQADCAALGLTVRAAIADTPGAAWALARFGGAGIAAARTGDAIEQEAYATRSRAARRRGVALPPPAAGPVAIAAPGQTRQALARLPVAALRLDSAAVEGLGRLGLRRIEDIMGLPRAGLARRFGAAVLRRLDQALGLEPEPVSPARAPLHFAARLTLPDPIGLVEDVQAGVDRLLPQLCLRLRERGRGARRVRLQAFRTDGSVALAEVGLARPADDPARIRPLLALKLEGLDAGFGFDLLRLEAVETEPIYPVQHGGQLRATAEAQARATADTGLDDLIGRLGARLGVDAVLRVAPADSHIPEKATTAFAAAWAPPPVGPWPLPPSPRPLVLHRPEMVEAPDDPMPPAVFRWRGQALRTRVALGPERIAPEWWLDDPAWRSGPRDYWRVETERGDRLWLFYAHGRDVSGGWFCQGAFA